MPQTPTVITFKQWRAQRKPQATLFAILIAIFTLSLLSFFLTQFAKGVITETGSREYVLLIDGSPHAAARGAPQQNRSITRKQYDNWIFYERLSLAVALLGALAGASFFVLVARESFIVARSLASGTFPEGD